MEAWVWVVIAVAAIVVLAAIVWFVRRRRRKEVHDWFGPENVTSPRRRPPP
jgi:LPXTG-motif cell wall-anchored protein